MTKQHFSGGLGVQTTKDGSLDAIYGLAINFSGTDLERWANAIHNSEAKKKVEVGIWVNGKEHTFTFREFFDRLGIEHTLPDEPVIAGGSHGQ